MLSCRKECHTGHTRNSLKRTNQAGAMKPGTTFERKKFAMRGPHKARRAESIQICAITSWVGAAACRRSTNGEFQRR